MPSVKAGDTLEIDCVRKDDSGVAVSLDDISVKSQMRRSEDPLVDLTVTIIDSPNGEFQLSLTAAQTDVLTPGNYSCDIQFTSDITGYVLSTETFIINLILDVTSAES